MEDKSIDPLALVGPAVALTEAADELLRHTRRTPASIKTLVEVAYEWPVSTRAWLLVGTESSTAVRRRYAMWPELTEEQRAFQEMVRSFAEREVAPRAADIDRNAEFPWDLWKQGAELGLLGITSPEEYGGSGLGVVEMCIMAEEVGAVCGATSVSYIHQADLVIDNLARSANEAQRQRWLPGLCDGSLIGCLAMTEPEAGPDVLAMRTTAAPVDGGFRVNGTKTFITNAPIADVAYVYLKIGG